MVIDFSNIDYKSKPVLVLRNLDGTAIQTLGYAFNIEAEFSYNEISTITFDLPKYINGTKTPHYDDVVGMRIIDLHNVGQFILINPNEESDGIKTIKSCTAYSLEYEFAKKTITLESGTYNFWNPLLPDDTILGRILEKMPDWTIGNVDSDLIGRYRTFDVTENKIYDFMKSDVQESYGCIFEFDTYKRTINVASVNSEIEQKIVYLSKERLIKEIEIEEDSDSIVTCLDVNGADGVTIRSVNPTGTNKIYNLDYFMNTSNFTNEFISKWRQWEDEYEKYRTIYYNTSIESNLQTVRKLAEQANLTDLKGELTDLENQQAVTIQAISQNIQNESALKAINKSIDSKKKEISAQENKISGIDNTLTELNNTLVNIKSILAWDRQDANGNYVYFTPSELNTLKKYFIEDSVQDSSFVAATTATYDNEDINNPINNIKLSIDKCSIDTVTSGSKTIKTITGGTLNISALNADIIKATVEFNTDRSFVFTASLNSGKINDVSFTSGNITVIGNYKTTSTTTSALSFNVYDGTLYFTKNTTEYEQHMIEWELYEYGKQVLSEKASPTYEFSIESGNFLAADEFTMFKNELTLGKRVYLKLDDSDVITPYVVTVRINYEDASDFDLEFSSTYTTFDKQFKLAKLLEQSVSLGKTLNAKSGVYEEFVSSGASTSVKRFMDSALDIAKNTVLSTGHQAIEFGDAGIRVRKWNIDSSGNPTTEYEPEEIWIVDNMIAFTEDSWNSSCMAIGKIFDESFGDYEKANSTYDSSKVYYYRSGTQEPFTYKPYTYNTDTWSTEWSKLYCRSGGVKYGIAAPYLVGTILAGRNLFINTDGGYFRVDDNGVYILNEKFVIASSNGNGLTFTADDGLVHKVTVNGKTYEAGFSATNHNKEGYGLYYTIDGKKKLYFDVDKPELVVDGSIWAREIYLGSDHKNIIEYCSDDSKYKISGEFIEGRGLRAYDRSGDLRVEIDGYDGSISIYDGYIYMTNGRRSININPDDGLIFKNGNTEIIRMDINNGSISLNWDETNEEDSWSYNNLHKLANGTYSGGTFIDAKTISSPTVRGGHIVGGKFFAVDNVNATITNGDIKNCIRMVLDSNGIKSYNASNQLDGVSLTADSGFGRLSFYYNGNYRGALYQSAGNIVLNGDQRLIIGGGNGDVQFHGDVDFSRATVTGLTAKFG